MSDEKLITPEAFSERVLVLSKQSNESILESLTTVVQELDLEEETIKKLITPPLYSRLEAECADNRLIKRLKRSKKLTMLNGVL